MLFLIPKFQKSKLQKVSYFLGILFLLMSFGCEDNSDQFLIIDDIPIINQQKEFKILSLGDSYTIGESVCETCRFPEQLKDSLSINFKKDTTFSLQVIARTGWTTTNLINAIEQENITDDFDLVTLLIGVNNQFQSRDFSIYQKEFSELISTSIKAANNIRNNVIVVSIPDYAFTPFGRGSASISSGIDKYNDFAKFYCEQNGITFINITDITREGLKNTNLVASDGLHPSELAYTKFVERILPLAIKKLKE
jgi:lysophospholipase L1-like esterase